jgi:hypothetical protein
MVPEIKGVFKVNKINQFSSNIQYIVLFLQDRMIFVKSGSYAMDGNLLGKAIGGGIGGAVGGLASTGLGNVLDNKIQKNLDEKEKIAINNVSNLSIEEILKLDKHNFEIMYVDISKIDMKKTNSGISFNGARCGTLGIKWRKKEGFDIAVGQDFDECEKFVSTILHDKMG